MDLDYTPPISFVLTFIRDHLIYSSISISIVSLSSLLPRNGLGTVLGLVWFRMFSHMVKASAVSAHSCHVVSGMV